MADKASEFSQKVLDHYEDPYHRGPLEAVTHVAEAENHLCGDRVRIEMRVDREGVIAEAWFDAEGCVISQSAASMLMEQIEQMTTDEVREFSANQMLELIGSDLATSRGRCCLLAWRATQTAIDSPVSDDDSDDPSFGGPSLSEEC